MRGCGCFTCTFGIVRCARCDVILTGGSTYYPFMDEVAHPLICFQCALPERLSQQEREARARAERAIDRSWEEKSA